VAEYLAPAGERRVSKRERRMAKKKKRSRAKETHSPESPPTQKGPTLAKRFLPLLLLALVAVGVTWGTLAFLGRGERRAAFERLPNPPDLTDKSKNFRQELSRADERLRQALASGEPGEELGRLAGRLGRLYQANSYYERAEICFQMAMELETGNARWPYRLASLHQIKGGSDSVIGWLERTTDLDPEYSPAWLKLGDNHFKAGHLNRARESYERRLQLSPDDPYALLGLARIAMAASLWEEAEKHLKQALEYDPNFGAAHRALGSVHEHFGRLDEKQKHLGQAIEAGRFRPAADPWTDDLLELSYDTNLLLVEAFKAAQMREGQRAADLFERAMKLDPDNPQVYLMLGKTVTDAGEAQVYFKKAISLDPNSAEAYRLLGEALEQERNPQEAETMYRRALSLDPNQPETYNNLGLIVAKQGKFREAEGYMVEALALDPESIDIRYNLAWTLHSAGKIEEAAEQYRQLLELRPTLARAANGLAVILSDNRHGRIRDNEEALRWALVACSGEGKNNPLYLSVLAAIYNDLDRFELAVQTAERSLELARSGGRLDLARELEDKLKTYQRRLASRF